MILLIQILIGILGFAVAITIHEFAHAWMSDKLGDPTARIGGRLSLNPLDHYDPIGTTLFLATFVLYVLGKIPFPFGWAKPVMYDPYNLKEERRDAALISFAGPLANLIFAGILSIILRLTFAPFSPTYFVVIILVDIIVLNISLAIFNLIPIHPLDGGKILVGLLPEKNAREVNIFLTRYGSIILLFLIFPIFGGNSLISSIISPIVNFFFKILIP